LTNVRTYVIIVSRGEGNNLHPNSERREIVDVITSIANLISSLLALITAIIAYRLAKHHKGD